MPDLSITCDFSAGFACGLGDGFSVFFLVSTAGFVAGTGSDFISGVGFAGLFSVVVPDFLPVVPRISSRLISDDDALEERVLLPDERPERILSRSNDESELPSDERLVCSLRISSN